MQADIQLTIAHGIHIKLPLLPEEIRSLLSAMLDAAGCPGASLELLCVDDDEIQTLNEKTMHCSGPTNILSFPQTSGNSPLFLHEQSEIPAPFLGSLVLSVDTLQRESVLYGQPADAHLIHLLAHGVAHLLGYDHGPAMDSLSLALEKTATEAYKRSA